MLTITSSSVVSFDGYICVEAFIRDLCETLARRLEEAIVQGLIQRQVQ